MKKIFIVLALLIAAVAAALPWINGLVMEKLVRNATARVNQMYQDNGTDIRFELTDYHRGYADTRAEWTVDLGNLAQVYGIKEVLFTERASHGWTAVTSETSLEKNDWYADWVKGPMKGKDPLTIRTRYSAVGPIVSTIALEEFTHDSGARPLKIGAAEFKISLDRSFEKVSTSGSWQGLEENEENRLGPVSLESEMEKITSLVWQGQARGVVGSIVAQGASGAFQLSNLSFSTDIAADETARKMDIATVVKAEEIQAGGRPLSNWTLGMGIRGVDIEAYEELYRIYAGVVQEFAPVLADPNLPQDQRGRVLGQAMAASRPQLVAQFEKMLKKGFTLEISPVDITLPQGQIKGHLSLGLLKDMTLAGFFPVATRPELILDIFSLDSEVDMPGEFLQMQPNLTRPLFHGMKTGLFVLKGDRLFHRAETRDKVLYVNGEAVDLRM